VLTLEGRSQSNARVSTYMRNLESSGWMTNPDLSVIEAKGDNTGLPYVFTLKVKLANPNAPKDTDGDGVPDAPVPPVATTGMAPALPATEAAPATAAPAPANAAPAPPVPATTTTTTPAPAAGGATP
jgi:type IV pilus assembly protein PilN